MSEQGRTGDSRERSLLGDEILRRVQKPGRYTGGEWNEIRKDPDRACLKIALAFPDLYEIGMSYLGQKILYHLLNERAELLVERVFAPWGDYEKLLRGSGRPLVSLENRIPLRDFDIVGFSLLYELNYSNILTMLDLGGIPLLSSRRTASHPLVIAGGPAAFNPEPTADFFDAFVIGDGEEVFGDILDLVKDMKREKAPRDIRLRNLSRVPGVYVPSLSETFPSPDSPLLGVRPLGDVSFPIRKRCLLPISDFPFPSDIIVPNIEIIFDRVSVEAARGCPRNCRFCQARSLYFPERRRPAGEITATVLNSVRSTGYGDASLAALSIGDYPDLPHLIDSLMDTLGEEKVALSLSSLRPRGLTPEVAESILRVRKTGFTLVPEAGTERLRTVINKHLTDEEIRNAVDTAFDNGWRKIKLYFMVGLPTETEADVWGITETVREIISRGRSILGKPPQINVSVSSFIPKPHTPFQWAAMDDDEDLRMKHRMVRDGLKRYRSVRVKSHHLENSILEGVFSRGDRRLGGVLLRAWRSGARFDGWTETFDFGRWREAFEYEGVDPGIYLGAVDRKAALPWDHISSGIRRCYFEREYQRAMEGKPSPPCRPDLCAGCGGCETGFVEEEGKSAAREKIRIRPPRADFSIDEERIHRYRVVYAKTGSARFMSHRDMAAALQRSFRRAGVPMEYSRGFHPKMLMSFAPALPLGMAGEGEVLEFRSRVLFDPGAAPDALDHFLPRGLKIGSIREVEPDSPRLSQAVDSLEYSLNLEDPLIVRRLAEMNHGRPPAPEAARRIVTDLVSAWNERGGNEETAAPLLQVGGDGRSLGMTVETVSGRVPRAQDIFQAVFKLAAPPVFAVTRVRIHLREPLPAREKA